MPRMFDILKNKANEAKQKEESLKGKEAALGQEKNGEKPGESLSFPKAILSLGKVRGLPEKKSGETNEKREENHFLASKKLIAAVKRYGVDNHSKSEEIYEHAVDVVKLLLEKIKLEEDIRPYMGIVNEVLDNMFNQLVLGDSILVNIYDSRENEYYLPYHIVNVLVLSSLIGLNMGFNKSRLSHLGLACIFYDTGVDMLRDIVSVPRKLTELEYKLVRSHIKKSLQIAESLNLNDTVKETILTHHERINGKGYPAAVYDNEINPYAKIIALADTYEALTNYRSHRQAQDAHKAVRFILSSLKDSFDPEVIKVFINKMSLYPIGSIVKLSTQELARVISVQPGSPLRPVVMIVWDSSGKPVKERIMIDLAKDEHSSILLQVYSKPSRT